MKITRTNHIHAFSNGEKTEEEVRAKPWTMRWIYNLCQAKYFTSVVSAPQKKGGASSAVVNTLQI